jgi:8-oxo-dGTP pyrophosphatase MutT (NUDIX family)
MDTEPDAKVGISFIGPYETHDGAPRAAPGHPRLVQGCTTVEPMSTWTDPQVFYAQLPSFYAAAAALITDPDGNVLLVKPNYRDRWTFPGGCLDAGEFPHDACRREVNEELGIDLDVGNLLVLDVAPPAEPRPRAIISFTFDCGTLPNGDTLRLSPDELDAWAFLPPDEAARRLPDNATARVDAALTARRTGATIYLANGQPATPSRRP